MAATQRVGRDGDFGLPTHGFASAFLQMLRGEAVVPPRLVDFMRDRLGLTPSPVMAAIADASQGMPVDLDDDTCRAVFNCPAAELPRKHKRTVAVRAGRSSGKTSYLGATSLIHSALTVPLPLMAPGERARSYFVGPTLDDAKQGLSFVRGFVGADPELRRLVVESRGARRGREDGDTLPGLATIIALRRPTDGRIVELRAAPATYGGRAMRGKTLIEVVLDEACFFYTGDAYRVTDTEVYRATIPRIVPGGRVWVVSSPWVSGEGLLEELMVEWGTHGSALCAQAPTRLANPSFDPDGSIEAEMRQTDPENAERELGANPLPAGSRQFFAIDDITAACVLPNPSVESLPQSWCGVDLGFRKNSSTAAFAHERDGKAVVVLAEELRPTGGSSLKPSMVVKHFADLAMRYGARRMQGDLHYADTAHEELAKISGQRPAYDELDMTTEAKTARYTEFRRRLVERRVLLPNDARLKAQMRRTAIVSSPGGNDRVVLPKIGLSHGDILEAVVTAAVQVPLRGARVVGRVGGDSGRGGDSGGGRLGGRGF